MAYRNYTYHPFKCRGWCMQSSGDVYSPAWQHIAWQSRSWVLCIGCSVDPQMINKLGKSLQALFSKIPTYTNWALDLLFACQHFDWKQNKPCKLYILISWFDRKICIFSKLSKTRYVRFTFWRVGWIVRYVFLQSWQNYAMYTLHFVWFVYQKLK